MNTELKIENKKNRVFPGLSLMPIGKELIFDKWVGYLKFGVFNFKKKIFSDSQELPQSLGELKKKDRVFYYIDYRDTALDGVNFDQIYNVIFFGFRASCHDSIANCYGSFKDSWDLVTKKTIAPERLIPAFYFSSETYLDFPLFLKNLRAHNIKTFYMEFKDKASISQAFPVIRSSLAGPIQWEIRGDRDILICLGLTLGRPLTQPIRAVIEIYNDCNLKCDFCWTHSPYSDPSDTPVGFYRAEIKKERVFNYVDEIANRKIENVELCAIGDPLFNPSVWEIISKIKSRHLALRISTNGTLITKQKAEFLVNNFVDQLFINISSSNRDSYAEIHNVNPRIFDSLYENLALIKKLKNELGRISPKLTIINVLTGKNCDQIPNMIKLAHELGACHIDFRKVWFSKDFLKAVLFSTKQLEETLQNRQAYLEAAKNAGVAHNLEDFFEEVERDLAFRKANPNIDLGPENRPVFNVPKSENIGYATIDHSTNTDEIKADRFTKFDVKNDFQRMKVDAICSMGYSFSLLDNDSSLRYCCMGERKHSVYKSLKQAWTGDDYKKFRDYWRQNYKTERTLCTGCPHIAENKSYHQMLIDFDLQKYILEDSPR